MRYEVKGGQLPVVEIHLEGGESIQCEKGAMSWMTANMQMLTKGGGIGKMFKNTMGGEAMFTNTYTAQGGPGMIAMSTNCPGSINAVELKKGESIICQKGSHLASTPDVAISIYLQKKIGTALFGGEGFIMQKITGPGLVFLEVDGSGIEYLLGVGEKMVIDTGYLAMMDATCTMEIESVKGLKNMVLGGEGLFNTIVTGPGRLMVQTMPMYQLANRLVPYLPTSDK